MHSTLEGLGLFPFHAHHVPAETGRGVRRIEIRGTKDTPFIRENEKLRGYEVGGFALANPGNPDQYCFAYRNMNSEAETGVVTRVSTSRPRGRLLRRDCPDGPPKN